jgi:HEPN domain-containing protein
VRIFLIGPRTRGMACRWLAYARPDLDAAQELLQKPDSYPRQVYFLAPQTAEKTFKAALIFVGVNVYRSHDLMRSAIF